MTRSFIPVAAAFAVAGTLGVAGAVAVPAASAKPRTLQLYQVEGPTQFYNAGGKKIDLDPPATLPVAGDSFDETDTDYAGTSTRHAKTWSATDHLTCRFTSADTGVCNAQFAVGGSLLLVNNFTMVFNTDSMALTLSEGTGRFAGTHGTLSVSNFPNGNADVVIKVS